MTVDATVNYGSITYEWYYTDSTGTKVTLDENSNTVEITDPSNGSHYTCCLWDDNGSDVHTYASLRDSTGSWFVPSVFGSSYTLTAGETYYLCVDYYLYMNLDEMVN